MKDEINLLPPSTQLLRRRRLYLLRTGQIFRRIEIVVVLLAVVLGISWFFLRSHGASVAEKIDQTSLDEQKVIKDVQTTTELVTTVHRHLETYPAWMPLVKSALEIMPADVKVTTLTIHDQNRTLAIQGIFTEREAVSRFQDDVRGLPWVEKVEAPLSNFATGTETGFSLTITRKANLP